jgi:glutathione S-transferase
MSKPLPILYSFRRCPYAIRTRMVIRYTSTQHELREVLLKDKPQEMLEASSKGTVPVLVTDVGVLEESLDIIYWALKLNDPDHWLGLDEVKMELTESLIHKNDHEFKQHLDRYKYSDRYPGDGKTARQQAEGFIRLLEAELTQKEFLLGAELGLADVAISPFIRQFVHVDKNWFADAPYPFVRQWLNRMLKTDLFEAVMDKHQPWRPHDQPVFINEPVLG